MNASPPRYARNEVVTDTRTGLVFGRNGLLFPELQQSLDEYATYWKSQNALPEQAFAAVGAALNRTPYP